MTSRRQWLRAGRLRLRVPGIVRVRLDERSTGTRQRVDVRLTAPVLGEVFRYAGEFDYRVVAPTARRRDQHIGSAVGTFPRMR